MKINLVADNKESNLTKGRGSLFLVDMNIYE